MTSLKELWNLEKLHNKDEQFYICSISKEEKTTKICCKKNEDEYIDCGHVFLENEIINYLKNEKTEKEDNLCPKCKTENIFVGNIESKGKYILKKKIKIERRLREYPDVTVNDLGKGGFGTIQKYQERDSGKIYVVKKFEDTMSIDFIREVCFLKYMKGIPHVVDIKEIYDENSAYSMDLHTMDLQSFSKNVNPLDKFDVMDQITEQILIGYYHLKKLGIIHADIKPLNFLIDCELNGRNLNKNKKIRIFYSDFGLTQFYGCRSTESMEKSVEYTKVSERGNLYTVYYIAPEIFESITSDVNKSDLWAIGYSLLQIIFGEIDIFNYDKISYESDPFFKYRRSIFLHLKEPIDLNSSPNLKTSGVVYDNWIDYESMLLKRIKATQLMIPEDSYKRMPMTWSLLKHILQINPERRNIPESFYLEIKRTSFELNEFIPPLPKPRITSFYYESRNPVVTPKEYFSYVKFMNVCFRDLQLENNESKLFLFAMDIFDRYLSSQLTLRQITDEETKYSIIKKIVVSCIIIAVAMIGTLLGLGSRNFSKSGFIQELNFAESEINLNIAQILKVLEYNILSCEIPKEGYDDLITLMVMYQNIFEDKYSIIDYSQFPHYYFKSQVKKK